MDTIKKSYITLKEWGEKHGMGYFETHYKYRIGFIPEAKKKRGRILIKVLNNKQK